ncbi:CRISPR-associated helicase Cas3' [Actinokineospora sp. 24-640]
MTEGVWSMLSVMLEVWGKKKGLDGPYPLVFHLLDAAAAAFVLWESHVPVGVRGWLAAQWGMDEEGARWVVALLAGWHDIGKAGFFQEEVSRDDARWVAHEQVSYLSVPSVLGDPGSVEVFAESVAHRVGEVLGGHHGVFPQVDRLAEWPERSRALGGVQWQGRRRELVEAVRRVLGEPGLPSVFPAACAAVVTGLVIVADWVVSETRWIKESQWGASQELGARWVHTLSAMGERVAGVGLGVPRLRASVSTRELLGESPRALQRSIEEEFRPAGSGLLVVTAPTGVGKTEAVAVAARVLGEVSGRPGVVWCLPTRATTNAMWRRWTRFAEVMAVESTAVTLGHSMASFDEGYREYCVEHPESVWVNDPHRPMLAGLSVVTVDQVLIAGLATRLNMVRLWALAGKVLVVDEVHALEPYMLALLGRVLSWCGFLGVPVVLLSATLPASVQRELTGAYLSGVVPTVGGEPAVGRYPGWVFTGLDGGVQRPSPAAVVSMREDGRRTARVECEPGRRGEVIAGYAQRVVGEGGCVAVVCATVPAAQITYQRLVKQVGKDRVTLLHARFPEQHRVAVEQEVSDAFGKDSTAQTRARPRIVVSTSLLEQSLDVDFDLVISDLAPIAQLLQRLGRCHRHARTGRPGWLEEPRLVVLDPVGELPPSLCALYPEYELLATRTVLAEHGPLVRVPEDVDTLVQRVHSRDLPPLEPEQLRQWKERHDMTELHRALAGHSAVPAPSQVWELHRITHAQVGEAAMSTRLGVDSARVIPYTEDADGKRWLADGVPLPGPHLNRDKIKLLVDHSIPCPQDWVDNPKSAALEKTPERWTHPVLRRARLLPKSGRAGLRVDKELGLVKGRLDDEEW